MSEVPRTRFIGRGRECGAVQDLVAGSRLVTLTGMGGVGKSRLAAEVAEEVESAYSDGVAAVMLAEVTDAALLGHAIAGALGLQLAGGDEHALLDLLRDRHVLIWLDNCEHLIEPVASIVAGLIRECPRVSVLVTSRIPLGIAGEAVYDVPAMDTPAGAGMSVGDLAGVDAIRLFVDRARAASDSFQLTTVNAPAVAGLVIALDGMPLAIELAAARVRTLAPQAMLSLFGGTRDQPGRGIDLLERRHADEPSRRGSVAASMEWSYRLCTPAEQLLWSRLAVFVGGFDLAAVEFVCTDEVAPIRVSDVVGLVMSLADQSVISLDPDHPGRYRMLEPVRQYGAKTSLSATEAQRRRDAHMAWYETLTAAAWAQWSSPDQLAWLARLRLELPNIRAALDYGFSDPRTAAIAQRILVNLGSFWSCDGAMGEARHWADLALARPVGTAAEQARTAAMASWFGMQQLDQSYASQRLAESARAVALLDTDPNGDAEYLRARTWARAEYSITAGLVAIYEGDFDAAVAHEMAAADELERHRMRDGHPFVTAGLFAGIARAMQGDLAEATRLCSESLALSRARGELMVRTASLWTLGIAALGTGDPVTAEQHELEALDAATQLNDTLSTGLSLEALGWVESALGRGPGAARLLGAAESIWRRIQVPVADSPSLAPLRAGSVALVTATIGQDAYERAFAAGMTTDISAVLTLARTVAAGGGDERMVTAGSATFEPLSTREVDVARLVADGLADREIAERLFLSIRTVHGHIRNILTKLDANSRTSIATWYVSRSEPRQ